MFSIDIAIKDGNVDLFHRCSLAKNGTYRHSLVIQDHQGKYGIRPDGSTGIVAYSWIFDQQYFQKPGEYRCQLIADLQERLLTDEMKREAELALWQTLKPE